MYRQNTYDNSYGDAPIDDGLKVGEELQVYALPGRGESIVGRYKTGKVILFNDRNEKSANIPPHSVVRCVVQQINERTIIVDPLDEGDTDEELVRDVGLSLVAETNPHPGNLPWEIQILANALRRSNFLEQCEEFAS